MWGTATDQMADRLRMDLEKVDLLIKFALAAAGREDPGEQELGPIHLVKNVYLADLAYAEKHGGETFTGIPWRFHHFGPWALEVYNRIGPVARDIGAAERIFPSRYGDEDAVRRKVKDDELYEELYVRLPSEVGRAIRTAVHKFGDDTNSLLHHVYLTPPMLGAAPGDVLVFRRAGNMGAESGPAHTVEPKVPLSAKERKRRNEALAGLRARIQERLRAPKSREMVAPPSPRYDQVFLEGQRWLDALAGEPVERCEGELEFSEAIWKSSFRSDPGVP